MERTCDAQRAGGRITCILTPGHYPATPHQDKRGTRWQERPRRTPPPMAPPDLNDIIPFEAIPGEVFIPDPFDGTSLPGIRPSAPAPDAAKAADPPKVARQRKPKPEVLEELERIDGQDAESE